MAKGRHQYVFWYSDGLESELLASFVALAENPRSNFDWFDAAVMSYEMGKHAERNVEAEVNA